MKSSEQHKIIFLGVAEKAAFVSGDGPINAKWNVLGLRGVLFAYFFPIPLGGMWLCFAVRSIEELFQGIDIRVMSEANEEVGRVKLQFQTESPSEPTVNSAQVLLPSTVGWLPIFVRLDDPLIFPMPGRYLFVCRQEGFADADIGEIYFGLSEPLPLTPERVAAIKSDPEAAKAVRVEYGCTSCSSKVKAYAALDRSELPGVSGDTWYEDIPDEFKCSCGTTRMDLRTVKKNLFGLVGGTFPESQGHVSLVPQYEASVLRDIRLGFKKLIDEPQNEEAIQKFIERNPILLHQFPSLKLFFKAPILTRFKTDFVVLTPQRELVLIEIEPAVMPLLKKNGDMTSGLSHAMDQVRNWLHDADEHRLAILDSLKIPKESVSAVRGVVVAGRDKGYDADHLRRLKGQDRGRVTFLTYDDLLGSMESLEKKIHQI